MGRVIAIPKVGQVFPTKHWGDITVVEYVDWNNVTIMFSDGSTKVTATKEVKSGSVKNKYQPEVCEVGFMGEGKFTARIPRGVNSPEYEVWRGVIRRCYSPESLKKHPTYRGCTVCEKWHNFQNFAEWYTKQRGYNERWHLDKDLTIIGNKVYCPEACRLIPCEVNSLFTGASQAKRGANPKGVHWCNTKKIYVAQIHVGGKAQEFLGYHKSAESAFTVYKLAKEAHVKNVAETYRDSLTPVIYSNLMNYTVSITD